MTAAAGIVGTAVAVGAKMGIVAVAGHDTDTEG